MHPSIRVFGMIWLMSGLAAFFGVQASAADSGGRLGFSEEGVRSEMKANACRQDSQEAPPQELPWRNVSYAFSAAGGTLPTGGAGWFLANPVIIWSLETEKVNPDFRERVRLGNGKIYFRDENNIWMPQEEKVPPRNLLPGMLI